MCIKSIYYNTYGDGSQDVTEHIETCSPGEMCRRPELREYTRKFRFAKLNEPSKQEAASDPPSRKSTPPADYFLGLPPTPRRSKSPSPSRKHESGVYINGARVAEIGNTIKRRSSNLPAPRERERIIIHAPEPPAPRLNRSSTMPVEHGTTDGSPRHRSRGTIPAAVHVPESPDRRRSTPSSRQARVATAEAIYVNDEREQRERRRLARRSTTGGSKASDHSDSSASIRKQLRWEDQVRAEIAAQNERISARPAVHQELRGILKHPKATTTDFGVYSDLRRALSRLDSAPAEKNKEQREDDQYWERLRNRFGEEPRDKERKRKSRVFHNTAGLYSYQ